MALAAPARGGAPLEAPVPVRRAPVPRPARPAGRAAPVARPVARARRRPRVAFWLFAVTVVGALVLALVSAQAFVAQSSFRTQELERQVDELSVRHGELRLQVAELTAPGRLAREAARHGMRLPDRVQVVRVPARDASSQDPPVPPGPGMALKGLLEGSP